MKRMLVFLVCLFALSTFPAVAADYPTETEPENILVRTKALNAHSFKLVLANLQQENTRIVLEDISGTRMYFNHTVRKHNGFATVLNLEKVPEGRYVLRIIQNNEALTQVIALKINV